MHRLFSLFSLALVCAVMLATACGGGEPIAEKQVVRPVKTFIFGESSSRKTYTYPGKVHANRTVDVAFEAAGKLADLPVAKGQEVKQGDLLGRLDQRDFANEAAAARAVAAEALATLSRYEQAAGSGAVSRQELDEARARARIAEAELKIREKALEDSEILASFDGVVSDRLVDNFQNVQAKQPVLRLQDLSILEIRINVPESDAAGPADVPIGGLVASFEAVPGREFDLDVKEFVSEADPVTQTYAVTLMLPRPTDLEILPGMTATVKWSPEGPLASRADTVPSTAVAGRADRSPWVWVVDAQDMTVSRREVEVGAIVDENQIQIVSGLESGDVVATAGVHHLAEGMKVREYR